VHPKCLCQEGLCSDIDGKCRPRAPPSTTPMAAAAVLREGVFLHMDHVLFFMLLFYMDYYWYCFIWTIIF